ncbi:rRNA biogenesis protein RRP36-like [Helianthus annuus]|uniref:rRNA biogenesis protein RRP36-like n=1 Tax=Helianthus annuus TaxID=4232 RepID=UPI000B8FF60D|nr:rRNA biogenesis protein RRP36-like [Helianthus annuus]
MLVDESEEEDVVVDEGEAEKGQDLVSPETDQFLKDIDYELDSEKAVGGNEGDDSSSSSSEEEIDETERTKRIQAEVEKEKRLKRKRKEDKDDELYKPSPEQVIESQTPPSSGGRKKASARKRVTSPQAAKRKLIVRLPKRKPKTKSSQPPSPPPEPSPPQSPPKQPTPPPSPPPHFHRYIHHHHIFHHHMNNLLLLHKLEEEKARRDKQNKYFELKNKELEAAKAMKEHEIYTMNKVLENMLGKSVEQRFEEIEVEEVRARRQAEIDVEMKYKGKGVEGVSEIAERSIVPSYVSESSIQNPRLISVVSGIFEEEIENTGLIGQGLKINARV